jgi:hypothetical protein
MSDFQQNKVSSVVWPWQQLVAEDRTSTRREAAVQVAIMWGVALLLFLFVSRVMAGVVAGVSLIVLTTGLWFPKAFRAIRKGLLTFGAWVGGALTWLLMVPFFYLAFVPARLVLLLKGKDPLTRAFPSPGGTMWVKHAPPCSAEQYERQF